MQPEMIGLQLPAKAAGHKAVTGECGRCACSLGTKGFSSHGEADFADGIIPAMRYALGGHVEKPAAKRAC